MEGSYPALDAYQLYASIMGPQLRELQQQMGGFPIQPSMGPIQHSMGGSFPIQQPMGPSFPPPPPSSIDPYGYYSAPPVPSLPPAPTSAPSTQLDYYSIYSASAYGQPSTSSTDQARTSTYASSQSKALNMMKKMGYEEGKGLGKDLQGPVTIDLQVNRTKAGLDFKKPEKSGLYKCNACDKVFNHITLAERHGDSKQHNGKNKSGVEKEKLFECVQCGLYFPEFSALRHHDSAVEHKAVQPTASKNNYRCDLCNITSNSETQWQQHLHGAHHINMQHKRGGKPDLKSEQDEFDFGVSPSTSSPNIQHINIQHKRGGNNEIKQEYELDFGLSPGTSTPYFQPPPLHHGETEYDYGLKEEHDKETINTTHSAATGQYDYTELRKKIKTEPNNSEASSVFSFPPLDTLYNPSSNLNTKSSPYQCEICQLGCNSLSQLQSHLISKHQEKSPSSSPHFCEVCQIGCNSSSQFQTHVTSKQHQDKLNPQKETAFKCNVCAQSFNSASQLSSHNSGKKHKDAAARQTVDNSALYCAICDAGFNSTAQKLSHEAGKSHQTRAAQSLQFY